MSRRVAAYAVCIEAGTVLLALHVSASGDETWSLPGGGVELGEDPYDTVRREFMEETGCQAEVALLLGVDSRTIPAEESHPGIEHQNIGVFYMVTIANGDPEAQEGDEVARCAWTPISQVVSLRRSSLVDVGLALAAEKPLTGHVPGVSVGGLIRH